ncbi:MAG: DUF389 domain-containing protein [Bacteroidota bacterium]
MTANDPKSKPAEATPGTSTLRDWFRDFMDLRTGSDRAGATQSIINGKQMRGSNAWMLVCSIMIASLGLNLNSGAVIIGAMLISPLMNPILGVGLGVGTNDRDMLWQSLRNFGVAIVIALVTSVAYFTIVSYVVYSQLPTIDLLNEQMRARTEPTILDALVAVFGGLAGIISVTRLDKTNAIPGVAIATALMPPLCVAGYGIVLAFSDGPEGFSIFWRASYLFFLNSFFIAITAYVIIRLLRFPYRKYVNAREKRRSQLIIGIVSIFMILPGLYILNDVLGELQKKKAARDFTERYFSTSKTTYQLNLDDDEAPVLVYPDRSLDADSLEYYSRILRDSFQLANATILTDTTVTASAMAGLRGQFRTNDARINAIEQRQQEIAQAQQQLRRELTARFNDSVRLSQIDTRLRLAFPAIEGVHLARLGHRDSTALFPLAAVQRSWPGRRPGVAQLRSERRRLQQYLQSELGVDSVILVIEDQ